MSPLFRNATEAALSDQIAILSRQVESLQEVVEQLAFRQGITPPTRAVPAAGPNIDAEVRMLVQQGRKIQAVKLVRERTGLRLKEAKDIVDRM